MNQETLLQKTEHYVRKIMEQPNGTLTIAHDFRHVERVRNHALKIAEAENYLDMELVEPAALLHDIGLSQLRDGESRMNHGPLGAVMVKPFLRDNSEFTTEQIDRIADAIHYHSLHPVKVFEHLQSLNRIGKLIEIIRDADALDGLGAAGIARAFMSHYFLPEYDPDNIKGSAWGLSSKEFRDKFGDGIDKPRPPVTNVIDQINQQIRTPEYLHTTAARRMAKPLVEYMRDFILQLEKEVNHGE